MKKILKVSMALAASVLMSIVNITPVIAADDDNYYYDVKKAGDYVLNYCNAGERDSKQSEFGGLPKGRIKRENDVFIENSVRGAGDCTNFVSQVLYYGGYKMKGIPVITNFFKKSGCLGLTENVWFYYKLKDNFDINNDVYSSSWVTVDDHTYKLKIDAAPENKLEASALIAHSAMSQRNGLCEFLTYFNDPNIDFSYHDIQEREHKCSYIDDLTYEEILELSEDKILRGDVIQIDFEGDNRYDHSTFVWCTQPEIRLSYHTNDHFAKSIAAIHSNNPNAQYRVIHTTDHADPTKSIW